jgi:predicted DCC family thiol-disulfide oxidoreductase YuxK
MKPNENAVVIFDGLCRLCDGAVRFLIARDTDRRLKFAASQSRAGAEILARLGLAGAAASTLVFVEDGQAYTRSTAVLRALRHVRGPWRAASNLLWVPRPLRDAVYGLVARHRRRWFGARESCRLPSADELGRFLP